MLFELLAAAVPAVSLLAVTAFAIAVWVVAQSIAPIPRSRSIGGRSRQHAVLLSVLPPSSHPDAAGHARPRAPGSLITVD